MLFSHNHQYFLGAAEALSPPAAECVCDTRSCMGRRLQGTGLVLENFTDIKHRLCFVCFNITVLKNKFSLKFRICPQIWSFSFTFFRVRFACTIVHRIYLPRSTELVWGLYVFFSEKNPKFILNSALSFGIYPQTRWLYKRSTVYVDLFGDFLFMDV